MRILIFHGYLLHGTGSNVYNAELGAALVRAGHELHLLCQDRAPAGVGLGRRRGLLGFRLAGRRGAPLARARDGLPARHRRRAAAVCRRSLRGLRCTAVPGAERRRGRALPGRQRGRRARGRRARGDRGRAGQPPRDGPGDLRPRRPASVRGQDPRQRAGVHRQALPALQALRRRGPRGRPRRARRLPPHRGEPVGGDGRRLAAATDASGPAGRRCGPFRAPRRGSRAAGPGGAERAPRRARAGRPGRAAAGAAAALATGAAGAPAAAPRRRRRAAAPRSTATSPRPSPPSTPSSPATG